MERLMTQGTLNGLRVLETQLEEKIRQMVEESSGHQGFDPNDDAGTGNALGLARGSLRNIGDLSEAVIITPRKDTDVIDCGNKVILKFEDGEDTIHLLGVDDAVYRKDLGTVTSADSPLGKAIFGKKAGDTVEIRRRLGQTTNVTIKEILPGDF